MKPDDLIVHYDYVFNFLLARTRDYDLTQDLTQQTFTLAIERFKQLRNANFVKSWLVSIAINTYRMYFRKPSQLSLDDLSIVPSSLPKYENILALRKVLRSIDKSNRELLLCVYVKGDSLKETAIQHNITVSALKMKLFRTKEKMREKLK